MPHTWQDGCELIECKEHHLKLSELTWNLRNFFGLQYSSKCSAYSTIWTESSLFLFIKEKNRDRDVCHINRTWRSMYCSYNVTAEWQATNSHVNRCNYIFLVGIFKGEKFNNITIYRIKLLQRFTYGIIDGQ